MQTCELCECIATILASHSILYGCSQLCLLFCLALCSGVQFGYSHSSVHIVTLVVHPANVAVLVQNLLKIFASGCQFGELLDGPCTDADFNEQQQIPALNVMLRS